MLLASQAGDADYSAATTTQSFQVTPAALTVSANNASRAFGAANPAFSGTVTGAVGSDSFSESFTTTATATSNVGSYPIVPSVTGTQLSNYNVTTVNGTLTVGGASTTTSLIAPPTAAYGAGVTLTATVASTAGTPGGIVTFYSGSTSVGTGTLNGSGVATLSTTTLPVGTDTLTASYTATGNFAASTSPSSSITVNVASQTISFPAIASHTYGSAPFAVTASSNLGSSYPVTITVQSGPAVISGGILTVTGVGTVVLQAAQAGNTDYSAATATQSFQVTPAQLTVVANNATRAFDTANPAFNGTVTGAVGSDSFSESFTTTATTSSNVGSYPIVPAVTGPKLANYTVSIVNGTLTVSAAATTTTLSAPGSATYGANVTLTATVTSAAGVPGGMVTFLIGSTPLGVGTVNAGGVATLSTAALPAGSDAVTASYAALGNFAASVSVATAVTVNGGSQTITFPPVGSHVYGSAPFAVTASSSAGSSYPVTISVQSGPASIAGGIVTLTGAGTVVLRAIQSGNAGYSAASATQSFQVTPAPLTVAANSATRSYGAANPAFSGTLSGAVGSDSFTESFATTATTSSNIGSYPISPSVSGAQLANYTVTTVPGELTVTGGSDHDQTKRTAQCRIRGQRNFDRHRGLQRGRACGKRDLLQRVHFVGCGALNGRRGHPQHHRAPRRDRIPPPLLMGPRETLPAAAHQGWRSPSTGAIATDSYLYGGREPHHADHCGRGDRKDHSHPHPAGGYSGTIALSCSNLPADASCTFAQTQLTLSGNNQSINTGLTINTTTQQASKDVPSQAPQSPFSPALFALVFWCPGGLTGLALAVGKRKLVRTQRLWHLCLLLAGAWALVGLSGCGMSGFVVKATPGHRDGNCRGYRNFRNCSHNPERRAYG